VIKKHKTQIPPETRLQPRLSIKGKITTRRLWTSANKNKGAGGHRDWSSARALLPEQDFYDLLSVTLVVQGVSLQLVSWNESIKNYRYLNLAARYRFG